MPRQRNNGSWEGRVEALGKRHSCTFSSRAAAAEWEREQKQRVRAGLFIVVYKSPRVGIFFNRTYETVLETRSKTAIQRRSLLEVLIKLLGADTKLTDIDERSTGLLKQRLLERGIQPSSVNNYAGIFNGIMKHANEMGHTKRLITMKFEPNKPPTKTRVVTPEEERALIEALEETESEDDRDLTTFLLHSGVRWSEAMKIEVSDYHHDHVVLLDTKNGKDRVVPLAAKARDALEKTITRNSRQGSDKVFERGYAAFNKKLKRIFQRLEMEDVTIHTFRHTAASRLAQCDVSILKIGKFLGHSSARMTERYAHLGTKDIMGITAALDGFAEAAHV